MGQACQPLDEVECLASLLLVEGVDIDDGDHVEVVQGLAGVVVSSVAEAGVGGVACELTEDGDLAVAALVVQVLDKALVLPGGVEITEIDELTVAVSDLLFFGWWLVRGLILEDTLFDLERVPLDPVLLSLCVLLRMRVSGLALRAKLTDLCLVARPLLLHRHRSLRELFFLVWALHLNHLRESKRGRVVIAGGSSALIDRAATLSRRSHARNILEELRLILVRGPLHRLNVSLWSDMLAD